MVHCDFCEREVEVLEYDMNGGCCSFCFENESDTGEIY